MTLYISQNGRQLGPYTLVEAQALVANGTVQATDWAWYEGIADWIPLQQVSGFTAAEPMTAIDPVTAPALPAAPMAASAPVTRPVLVWIICIISFVFTPLAAIGLVVSPYLVSFAMKTQQQALGNLQSQIDQTTDPAQKDRLIALQKQLADNQARITTLTNHGTAYYTLGIAGLIFTFIATLFLFLLRRIAFYLFAGLFVFKILYTIYNLTVVGLPHMGGSAEAVGMAVGFIIAGIIWCIEIAIPYYIWTLFRKGVLR